MTETPEAAAAAPAEKPALTPAERMAIARAARGTKSPAADPPAMPEAFKDGVVAKPSVPEPTVLERVAINAEDARQRKIDALRKAKVGRNDSSGEALVQVRVLKRGSGLISMGEHIAGLGELTYDAGETPSFPKSVAEDLEARGLAEIQ